MQSIKDEAQEFFKEILNNWQENYFPGYKKNALADEFDLTRTTVEKYFKGVTPPTSYFLFRLKQKFPEINMNEMFDIHFNERDHDENSNLYINKYNQLKRESELLLEQVSILKDHIQTLKQIQD